MVTIVEGLLLVKDLCGATVLLLMEYAVLEEPRETSQNPGWLRHASVASQGWCGLGICPCKGLPRKGGTKRGARGVRSALENPLRRIDR
jgi:hypothetical protein